MNRIPFEVVNCFAATCFAGNPMCVIREPVEERLMSKIAAQMACTLTIYPLRTGTHHYSMRMFTTRLEVPFGGSASLAGAWAMGEGRWIQSTSGGKVETEYCDGKAWTTQPYPEIAEIEDDEIAAAIGLGSVERVFLGRASGNNHVVAVTTDDPANFSPRSDLLEQVAHRYGGATVGAVRQIHAAEVHGRIFTPAHGKFEDPAVGGGAPTIACIMREHFAGAKQCVIRQGEEMDRPSRIEVDLDHGQVRVGGGVRKAVEGVLLIE